MINDIFLIIRHAVTNSSKFLVPSIVANRSQKVLDFQNMHMRLILVALIIIIQIKQRRGSAYRRNIVQSRLAFIYYIESAANAHRIFSWAAESVACSKMHTLIIKSYL